MLRRAAKRAKLGSPKEVRHETAKIGDVIPLGDLARKDDAEEALEGLVLGGETDLLESLEKFSQKAKVCDQL